MRSVGYAPGAGPGAGPCRFVIAVACLVWLSGCATSTKLGDLFHRKSDDPQTAGGLDAPAAADPATTGSLGTPPPPPVTAADPLLLGSDPNDDVSLGKKQYRAGNFGVAETYFRRAAEQHPRDADAWVGLAAAYDRLRRFDLADRAYEQASRSSARPRSS